MNLQPRSLFISHGGGPMPLLGDPGHDEMVSCLQQISRKITKPDAIIVVSAHWEASVPTITSGASPELIYDYYGFPPESYEIKYPCPGEPDLAKELYGLLQGAGLQARLDPDRGFDHGLFVPLKIMYPEADIPCIQLSLSSSLDPALHLAIGKALQGLNRSNVLVLGSGFTFHNMRAFFARETTETRQLNHAFEGWLAETCGDSFTEEQRYERLLNWSDAPGARFCHPREEHLLPLHVCYGVAEIPCSEHFELTVLGKKTSMYLW